ncbi:hypothetical protein [Lacisediminihabitans sp.]|uniref:hypothetical protein n=1 Tax=Lacisediminihabitans sp. TaxID=2787631 RepID=UPI00374C965B
MAAAGVSGVAIIRTIMKPFFAQSIRTAAAVGTQLADIFADPALRAGGTYFQNRTGSFPIAGCIADPARQHQLLAASLALSAKALDEH